MATPIPLSDVVSVNITASQALQSASGFSKPMLIDSEYIYGATGRVLTVGNLQEMIDAGYSTYHRAYRMAQLIFSQVPRPKTLKIGQWNLPAAETPAAGWAAIIAADPDFYWTCLSDRTEATINSFASEILSASNPYLFYAETSDAAVLSGAVGNVAEDLKNSGNDRVRIVYKAATPQVMTLVFKEATTAGTFVGSIDGNALSNAWAVDHDTTVASLASDIAATAGVTSAVVSSSSALGALDDTITVTASDSLILNKLVITTNYTGGSLTQSVTTQASAPLSGCMVGYLAPQYPGVKIEALAPVRGVAADSVSTAQRANLLENNCGWYGQFGQVASMGGGANYGRVASGTLYVDLKAGIDWLTIAVQASVMNRLQSGNPVPYTTAGIEEIKQAVASALAEGVQRGFIQPSGDTADGDLGTIGYTVTAPALSDISDANKTARHLPDVQFQARAAGAVQSVTINGNLSL